MREELRTVAVCTASPALTAILAAVLSGTPGLRVRQFERKAGLTTYMRLAPIALLVCDIEDAEMVDNLRHDDRVANRTFDVVALARTLTRDERAVATKSGIDEVILKPMSPQYLLERVRGRLDRRKERIETARDRRNAPSAPLAAYRRVGDNVIQLFPDSWQPNP